MVFSFGREGVVLGTEFTFKIFKVSRISELVQVNESDVIVVGQHVIDKIAADEAGTASDEICFHLSIFLIYFIYYYCIAESTSFILLSLISQIG